MVRDTKTHEEHLDELEEFEKKRQAAAARLRRRVTSECRELGYWSVLHRLEYLKKAVKTLPQKLLPEPGLSAADNLHVYRSALDSYREKLLKTNSHFT